MNPQMSRNLFGAIVVLLCVIFAASVYWVALNTQATVTKSEISVLRADLAREIERINRSEASIAEVRDRLARIETKVDAILDRTAVLERGR